MSALIYHLMRTPTCISELQTCILLHRNHDTRNDQVSSYHPVQITLALSELTVVQRHTLKLSTLFITMGIFNLPIRMFCIRLPRANILNNIQFLCYLSQNMKQTLSLNSYYVSVNLCVFCKCWIQWINVVSELFLTIITGSQHMLIRIHLSQKGLYLFS